jgi:Holliday junction resolvase RusA-like endonuclease
MISITLSSVPPSLNNSYINVAGRGRVPGKKLRVWKNLAGWELMAQRPGRIEGPVVIEISLKRPNKRSDIDNRAKAILDLLVSNHVIEDDRKVESVKSSWAASPDAPACKITVVSCCVRVSEQEVT